MIGTSRIFQYSKSTRLMLSQLTKAPPMKQRSQLIPSRRLFSTEPTIQEMENFLSQSSSPMTVTEVLGDQVVRVPSMDGVGIGNWVEIGETQKILGVILHFDAKFMTVGLVGNSRGAIRSGERVNLVLSDPPRFEFKIKKFVGSSFTALASDIPTRLNTTTVPLVDLLLGPYIPSGITVGIFDAAGSSYKGLSSRENIDSAGLPKSTVMFPSKSHTSDLEMYMDLIESTRKVMKESNAGNSIEFWVDLRLLENACKCIELQAGKPLPLSPTSLVGSVLQLSRNKDRMMSVIALANKRSDFHYELDQSVDLQIDVASGGNVTNLASILKRYASSVTDPVRKGLIRCYLEGEENSSLVEQREKEFKIFVDFWDKDETESFKTKKLLTLSTAACDQPEHRKLIVLRAITILDFQKSNKRNQDLIATYPTKLLDLLDAFEPALMARLSSSGKIESNLETLDQALIKYRFSLELTSPLV